MNETKNEISVKTEVFARKPKALELMASRMNLEPAKLLETLKATVFKGCSNEELAALVVVSNEYGLNPLLKEMYAFPGKGGGIVPIVSIDGWNKMMIRAENFDGIEFEFTDAPSNDPSIKSLPVSCTAVVYLKNRSHPVKVTEHYSECFRSTDPWKMMPRRMLRHKALIQAARIAFGFSGIYDEDEGRDQADVKKLEASKPVFDFASEISPEPKRHDLTPLEPKTEVPERKVVEQNEKSPEGDRTRRFNAVLQSQKLELGVVLTYLGELGYANFEDVSESLMKIIEKNPGKFSAQVRGDK